MIDILKGIIIGYLFCRIFVLPIYVRVRYPIFGSLVIDRTANDTDAFRIVIDDFDGLLNKKRAILNIVEVSQEKQSL